MDKYSEERIGKAMMFQARADGHEPLRPDDYTDPSLTPEEQARMDALLCHRILTLLPPGGASMRTNSIALALNTKFGTIVRCLTALEAVGRVEKKAVNRKRHWVGKA